MQITQNLVGECFMPDTDVRVLVVDLDGTLLRSDLLLESFWSAIGNNWLVIFSVFAALRRGRGTLKECLAKAASIDAATLPYDDQVLAYVEKWRQTGHGVVLVTGSHQIFADQIASHLGIFDEAHGSDGQRNLTAGVKAEFVVQKYGAAKFAYIGDAAADLPVWQHAAEAITVNASTSLRARVEDICASTLHLKTAPKAAKAYLEALRPHQWVKNTLVFVPMLAAHQLTVSTLLSTVFAFFCFSLIASSIYAFNDLVDLSSDRAHPRKRLRPFAFGRVPLLHGTLMGIAMLASGVLLSALVGSSFLVVILCYFAVTTGYTLFCKHHAFIDICVLAGLYIARIFAGGAATEIEISDWLMLFSASIFLSLGAVKRQAEIVDIAARGMVSAKGRGYRITDLPIVSMVAIGAGYMAVILLALYVNSSEVVDLYARPEALWGVSAVILFWITRMAMIANRGDMHDDPIIFAIRDKVSWICLVTILLLIVYGA